MRIISLNVSGLNGAIAKGLFDWLIKQQAEVICLQDTRLSLDEIESKSYQLPDYFMYAAQARNPVEGGSVIYSKVAPKAVIDSLNLNLIDDYGRFVQADFDKISVASLFFPHGNSDVELNSKYKLMDDLLDYFDKQRRKRRDYIYCASLFIAYQKLDVHDWRSAEKAAGFLPAERIWLDELIRGMHYVDALREVSRESGQFSFWSDLEQARSLNLGMRFDYQLLTQGFKRLVDDVSYIKTQHFSHHAPVMVDYAWQLAS